MTLYEIYIKGGTTPLDLLHHQHEIYTKYWDDTVYEARERKATFKEEEEYLLSLIPEEFRSWASYYAYEQGHSAGESECLNILHGLILGGLAESIQAYTVKLLKK